MKILSDSIMTETCHYTFVQNHRNEPQDVNCGLWVTVMAQCRFISCNKCTALVGDVNTKEAVYVWGRGIREISALPAQYCCEPKTALKM